MTRHSFRAQTNRLPILRSELSGEKAGWHTILKHRREKPRGQVPIPCRDAIRPGMACRGQATWPGPKNGEELSFSQSWMSKASEQVDACKKRRMHRSAMG